jgi:hypothetical protein
VGFLNQQFLFFFLPSFSSGTIMIITPSLFYIAHWYTLNFNMDSGETHWVQPLFSNWYKYRLDSVEYLLLAALPKKSINCSNSVSGNSRGCGKCSFSPQYRNHSSRGN